MFVRLAKLPPTGFRPAHIIGAEQEDEGEIRSCSKEPVRLVAESLEDPREDLEDYDWVQEPPWLEYRSIVPGFPEDDD